MREIKFRAWEMNYKEIIDVDSINFESKIINTECAWRMFSEVILMQYTGLKDKNGREIYEGDIVKNVGPYSPTVRKYGFGEFKYTNENLVVCKELVGTTLRHIIDFKTQNELPNGLTGMSPNGWYGPKPPIDNEQFWNFQRSFEVIGNIYENPELLEVNK
ncbi:MAG: YopX family protein [Kurthia gibsonii]